MSRLHPFQELALDHIHHEHLIDGETLLLAAVSGGPDSVALLHVLVSLKDILGLHRITVLHFDHQLRGEASRADAAFAKSLAEDLGLEFFPGTEDVRSYKRRHQMSLEMAARTCRHRFFTQAMDHFHVRRIALGHTASDQAEEILLRLFRGTGPAGLAGMRPRTAEGIIRPLLFATRREVLDYLHDCKLPFREDSSNLDPFCQRNALRTEIFPLLEKHFHPEVEKTLLRHTRLVQDEEACWDELVKAHWQLVCAEETPARVALRLPEILPLHKALRRRILRHAMEKLQGNLLGIYAVHVESLCRLITQSSPDKLVHLPKGLYAFRGSETLVLSKGVSPPFHVFPQTLTLSVQGPGTYTFGKSRFILRLVERLPDSIPGREHPSPDSAWLDADKIRWPMLIRLWQPGDRFRPLGLHGTKKLQDFFVDAKIPRNKRSEIPLLCDEERICWVVGCRLDDRLRVTDDTKRLLLVEREDAANREKR